MKSYRKHTSQIVVLLIISMILSSCKSYSSKKIVDNIVPDYNVRMYSIADLIPFNHKEIKNAMAVYGMELQEYFTQNTSSESESMRVTEKEKNDFYRELMYRTHNYKMLKNRYNMYYDSEGKQSNEIDEIRQKEYNEYYKIPNAKSIGIIKKYNSGKANGIPLMSIRAILDTATMSDTDSPYSTVTCEIYKPVYIESSKYDNLKIGDIIELDIPATNSAVNCKETHKTKLTYIATDSLLCERDNGEKEYYFIALRDGTNDLHRLVNEAGETVETYVETAPLQFLSLARVANANDPTRLLNAVINNNLHEYTFGPISTVALCGGYVDYKYKEYVYGNQVTTNLKGYITSVIEYDNQTIDNEFYKTLEK